LVNEKPDRREEGGTGENERDELGADEAAKRTPGEDEKKFNTGKRKEMERLEADREPCEHAEEYSLQEGRGHDVSRPGYKIRKQKQHEKLLTLSKGIGLGEEDREGNRKRHQKPLRDRQVRTGPPKQGVTPEAHERERREDAQLQRQDDRDVKKGAEYVGNGRDPDDERRVRLVQPGSVERIAGEHSARFVEIGGWIAVKKGGAQLTGNAIQDDR
jgi:hypothetical protein